MGKWVQIKEGRYRYVSDDDPRPAVHLKAHKGVPYLTYSPPWKRYEQNFFTPDALNQKSDAQKTDAFIKERDYQMKTDPKAKRWEESRKAEWAKNKPKWRKRMMEQGLI